MSELPGIDRLAVGRVALVTGGLGELGRAICQRLARQGAKVAAMDRVVGNVMPDGCSDWLAEMERTGATVFLVAADVTDYAACEAAVAKVVQNLGPVDILINCAGITRDASLRNMTKQHWDAVISTNLDSVFNVTKQVVDGMLERGYGRVVNISSLNAEKGQFGQSNYAAAKAGMHGFTMSLAQEVARNGVTVNTVSPGYMDTQMVRSVSPGVLDDIVAQIPMGRLGRTDEVASVVAFLASEEASYVTGANFSANGGHHMMH